jgi:hypothetical protein
MFDVNYVDFKDVTIKQGFFTSALTLRADDGRVCTIAYLVTDQTLNVYRQCQDIETKARIARRQFQLEENRSRTTQMQINNLMWLLQIHCHIHQMCVRYPSYRVATFQMLETKNLIPFGLVNRQVKASMTLGQYFKEAATSNNVDSL